MTDESDGLSVICFTLIISYFMIYPSKTTDNSMID